MDTVTFDSIDSLMAAYQPSTDTPAANDNATDTLTGDTREPDQPGTTSGDETDTGAGEDGDTGEGTDPDAQSGDGTDGGGEPEPDTGLEPGVPKFLNEAFSKLANATTDESRQQIESGIRAEFVKLHTDSVASQEARAQWDGMVKALEQNQETAITVLRHIAEQTAAYYKTDLKTFLSFGEGTGTAEPNGAQSPSTSLSMSDEELESFVDDNDLSSGEMAVAKAFNERLRAADAVIKNLAAPTPPAQTPKAIGEGAPPAQASASYPQVAKEIKAARSGFNLSEQDYNNSIKARPGLPPLDAVQLHMSDAISAHMAEAGRKTAPKAPLMPNGSNQTSKGAGVKPVSKVDDLLDMSRYRGE